MSDKQKYLKSLESRVSNIAVLSNKMKNFSHGINDTQPTDIRTQREKGADRNYIYKELRTKVYDLFNNDSEMAEEFLVLVTNSMITAEQFSIALPQLKTNFKGNIANPPEVMTNLRQLIQNFNDSGTVSGSVLGSERGNETVIGESLESALDRVTRAVNDAFDKQKISKDMGDELVDVIGVMKEEMPENTNLNDEEQQRIDDALRKLSNILESNGGSNLKKVAKKAKEEFHSLINLLTSDKTMSISIVLEEFVNIVESIVKISKDVQEDKDLKKAKYMTVSLLRGYMAKYGINSTNIKKDEMQSIILQYEIDNDITDGLFSDQLNNDDDQYADETFVFD